MEKKYTIAVAGTGYVVKKWEGAKCIHNFSRGGGYRKPVALRESV